MEGSRKSAPRRGLRRVAVITGCAAVAAGALWAIRGPSLPWAMAQAPLPAQSSPAPQIAPLGTSQDASGLDYCSRVVAYIYDHQPVTRQELGEYLIARFGAPKLKDLINRRVLDQAARSRGIEVTNAEVDLSLSEELKALRVDLNTFVKTVLPRYKKTLPEWKDDVLRPRLLMTRYCQKQVVVTEQEIQKAFEAEYGEKIQGRLIQWPDKEGAKAQAEYSKLRDSEEGFSDAAHNQQTAQLASTGGKLRPFGRHTLGDEALDDVIFKLSPGQITEVVHTPQGWVVFKCDARIPPDRTINPQSVREKLIKDIADRKIAGAIADTVKQLLDQAHVTTTLKEEKLPPGSPLPNPKEVIGMFNGNIGVTREEYGEYLINRYGADRVELLVNHKIIDRVCREQNIQVSDEEVTQALAGDLSAMNMKDEATFQKEMLSKWNKTIFEWKEDVVRPKLQLSKLARSRVKITEEDLKMAYEANHGEKRRIRMILFPKDQQRWVTDNYQIIAASEARFAEACRTQPTPSLAAKHGRVEPPIGRHSLDSEDLEREIFALQLGQVTPVVDTPQGSVIAKFDEKIEPDGKPMAEVREQLTQMVMERKVQIETQKAFHELRATANPKLLLRDATQPTDLAAESKRLLEMGHEGPNAPPPGVGTEPPGQPGLQQLKPLPSGGVAGGQSFSLPYNNNK
jgi:parvulin-like peptidyl-prolyl isomerase